MSERPTPETDALFIWEPNVDVDIDKAQKLCERLERQRNEAREKYAAEATDHMLAVNKLCNERDEARDELCHLRACVFDVMSALDAGAFTELRKAWEEGAK